MKITAALRTDENRGFERWELELGEPGPDEVLVRMVATGICHIDHRPDPHFFSSLPVVLGHEGEGVVERVGPGVTGFRPGDNVVMAFNSCGRCAGCVREMPGDCENFVTHNLIARRPDESSSLSTETDTVGSHFFGQSSFATHAVVSTRSLVAIKNEYAPLGMLGPLGCSFGTGAGAVLNRLAPETGSSIAIFGAGAVGAAAVLAANVAACTTIIAVNTDATGIGFGESDLGYTRYANAAYENPVEKIKEITGGRGVDYALETTGDPAMLSKAVDSLAVRGTVCLVGQDPTRYALPSSTDVSLQRGCTLTTSLWGDTVPQRFVPLLIELHGARRFPFHDLLTYYDFVDINQAVEDYAEGRVIKPILRFDRESDQESDQAYGQWSDGSD